MIIELSYPSSTLSPNKKNGRHWGVTKGGKDAAFSEAFYRTKIAAAGAKFRNEKIAVTITFVQSDKRKRDMDNLLANGSTKAFLDGIAKAISVDDRYFEPITIKRAYNKEQSATIIELKQSE